MDLNQCARPVTAYKRSFDTFGAVPDVVAEEVPVALVYNGISHVVMMALPSDLEEFAVGFSLSEGIIQNRSEIYGMDVVPACRGVRVELEVSSESFMKLKERRRSLAGRTGCGVCGLEQINDVIRPVKPLPRTATFDLQHLDRALAAMKACQLVGDVTGCTHAACLLDDHGGTIGCMEDVGRHVALDKLLGARGMRAPTAPEWNSRVVLISSRASYEMVQKAASCGVEVLLAVSAATGLAVETAEKAGAHAGGVLPPGPRDGPHASRASHERRTSRAAWRCYRFGRRAYVPASRRRIRLLGLRSNLQSLISRPPKHGKFLGMSGQRYPRH